MLKDVALKLRAGLVGATVMLACVGQAQAVQFIGEWDPNFAPGTPFSGYSWVGKVQVDVPAGCFTPSTTLVTIFGCPTMAFDWGRVDIYHGGSFVTEINFGAPGSILGAVNFSGGKPQSVKIGSFNQWVAGSPDWYAPDAPQGGGNTSVQWGLSFVNSLPVLSWKYKKCALNQACDETDGDDLDQLCKLVFGSTFGSESLGAQYAPTWAPGGFSLVPEPGSIALLVPALGMLVAFRRRRTAISA